MKRSFIREILEHTTDQTISFAGGLPDESLFPLSQLQDSAYKVFEDSSLLQYTISQGYLHLREKIAAFYCEEGFDTTSDQILITSGSQQALDIITRFYNNTNITLEAPSYLGAMNIFELNKMKILTVPLEKEGINIDEFKKSFKQTKLAYLIPDFQNPTGITYTEKKRIAVAKYIQKKGGILIEDSPYSALYFEQASKSISSRIPKQSYHLGSFSKVLAPAMRIGWIRADKELLQPLIAYKEAMDLHTNSVAQRIIDHYLNNSQRYNEHLAMLREVNKAKMEFFTNELEKILPMFRYTKPKGGMFVYGTLVGVNTSNLLKMCLKNDVVFVPGCEFYLDKKADNEIRFNFTKTTKEQAVKGLEIIKKSLLKETNL